MGKTNIKEVQRVYRHQRIRKGIKGTAARPRLCVHRSLQNFYAQVIDDDKGEVLCGLSTQSKDLKSQLKYGGNLAAAEKLGESFAKVAIDKGIKKVCFDRGGFLYHGRVKAFADAARKAGLEF